MKTALIFASLLLTVSAAHATYCKDGTLIASHPNGDCSKTIPVPTSAPTTATGAANQSQSAKAAADAAASAKSASTSAATGTGGTSTAGATGGSAQGGKSSSDASSNAAGGAGGVGSATAGNSLGSVGNDNSTTSFRALALSLPSPVFTPPMPLASCPQANVEQEAHAVGWNFYSQAHGSVNTDNCTAIIVYNAMLAQCQFESAQNILDGLMVKVMPAYKARPMSGLNLSPKECHDLNTPPIQPAPVVSVSGPDYRIIDRGPACVAPEPAKKGKPAKRTAKAAGSWKCKI